MSLIISNNLAGKLNWRGVNDRESISECLWTKAVIGKFLIITKSIKFRRNYERWIHQRDTKQRQAKDTALDIKGA